MVPETMETIRQRQDAAWKERPFTVDECWQSAIEIEHRIRRTCREAIASHCGLLRRAGIRHLVEVHDALRRNIAMHRRLHTESIARERIEARRNTHG
jgi:hypothetical protein